MENLHKQQKQGKGVKMVPGNKMPRIEVPENEQHLVHVLMQLPGYDDNTGKAKHQPFVQCYTVEKFNNLDKMRNFMGYKVAIVHDPRTEEEIAEDVDNDSDEARQLLSENVKGKKGKPVDRMNKKELIEKYTELFGVAPGGEFDTEKALREEITARIAFLESENK